MIKLYEYPKCSTCVKSKKFLKTSNIPFNAINIVENPPSVAELKKMLKSYDGDIGKLINKSGLVYRELNLKTKIPTMSQDEVLKLLNSNGKLVKRPFALSNEGNTVGFKEDRWSELFSS